MAISDYGTYIMYFNDEDGTFNVGLYSTGTVEADEFYEHNHEVARSTSPSDLSIWLGCFECDECPNTQDDMEKCFTEQISEQIDYDVIREAVTEVCQNENDKKGKTRRIYGTCLVFLNKMFKIILRRGPESV